MNWHLLLDNVAPLSPGLPIFTAVAPTDPDLPAGTVAKLLIQFQVNQGVATHGVTTAVVPRNMVYSSE